MKKSKCTGTFNTRPSQGLSAFNELDITSWDFDVNAFIIYGNNPLGFSLQRNLVVFLRGLVDHMCCFRLVY